MAAAAEDTNCKTSSALGSRPGYRTLASCLLRVESKRAPRNLLLTRLRAPSGFSGFSGRVGLSGPVSGEIEIGVHRSPRDLTLNPGIDVGADLNFRLHKVRDRRDHCWVVIDQRGTTECCVGEL